MGDAADRVEWHTHTNRHRHGLTHRLTNRTHHPFVNHRKGGDGGEAIRQVGRIIIRVLLCRLVVVFVWVVILLVNHWIIVVVRVMRVVAVLIILLILILLLLYGGIAHHRQHRVLEGWCVLFGVKSNCSVSVSGVDSEG